MRVESINIDSRQVYSGTQKLLAEKVSSNFNSFQQGERERTNNLSRDQKNSIVTDHLKDNSTGAVNDLRYQENSPVSKLLDIIKSFNETSHTGNAQFSNTPNISQAHLSEFAQQVAEEHPVGYYVVIDDDKKSSNKKVLKARFDLVKDRINKTYNLGFKKGNGSLVNLVA